MLLHQKAQPDGGPVLPGTHVEPSWARVLATSGWGPSQPHRPQGLPGRKARNGQAMSIHCSSLAQAKIGHGAQQRQGTCGLVAMTSASHAEGRQFDPGQVYALC